MGVVRDGCLKRVVPSQYEINGIHRLALLDNQASSNFMSLEFARIARCQVQETYAEFILGDGSLFHSSAYTQITCILGPGGPCSLESACTFHLRNSPIQPLVLGMPFLRGIAAFRAPYFNQKYCKHARSPNGGPQIGHNVCLKINLQGHQRTKELPATFDAAAAANLLPLEVVKYLGFRISTDSKSRVSLRLGNGSVTKVVGTVRTFFSICGLNCIPGIFRTTFVVVTHLPFHCVLGNSAIKFLEKLAELQLSFEWVCPSERRALFCPVVPEHRNLGGWL